MDSILALAIIFEEPNYNQFAVKQVVMYSLKYLIVNDKALYTNMKRSFVNEVQG